MIYKKKDGVLPLLKLNRAVEIISIMNILGLFIDAMGIIHTSPRVEVVIGKDPKNFNCLSEIFHEENLNIISVGISPYKKDHGKRTYSFLLDLCENETVVSKINKARFKVLSAID